jgi:outer membrane immunogenic protein
MRNHGWCIVGVSVLSVGFAGPTFAQSATWTGPYVGAFGGYGFGSQGQHDSGVPTSPPPMTCVPITCATSDGHYDMNGALGGALVGYNIPFSQFAGASPFIVGLEGDVGGSTVGGYSGVCGTGAIPPHTCGGSIPVMSDLRLRFGVPFGQWMPFVAGGLAVDDIRAYDTFANASGEHVEAGWTIGGGVEYKLTEQWSLRLEYLYQDFGRDTFFNIAPGVPEGIRTDANIVRAAIVWNFAPPPSPAPPVIAKY